MRSSGTDGYVSISSENDFEVIRQPQSGEKVSIIKIGRLNNGE
jgi:hypothetical protein